MAEGVLAHAADHGGLAILKCADLETLDEVRSAMRYVVTQNGPRASVTTDGLVVYVRLERTDLMAVVTSPKPDFERVLGAARWIIRDLDAQRDLETEELLDEAVAVTYAVLFEEVTDVESYLVWAEP